MIKPKKIVLAGLLACCMTGITLAGDYSGDNCAGEFAQLALYKIQGDEQLKLNNKVPRQDIENFLTQRIIAMTCLWEYCTQYAEHTKIKRCFEYFGKKTVYGSSISGYGKSDKDAARNKVKTDGENVCVVNDLMMKNNGKKLTVIMIKER